MTDETLLDDLSNEADLCRNEGADDIAALLDRAVAALTRPAPDVELVPAAWIKPDWQNPETYDGHSPVTTYKVAGWTPLYTLTALRGAQGWRPVAWLHTLHMEGGQTMTRLLDWSGVDCDEPKRTGFGLPGRDYSAEYHVTVQPLYPLPPAPERGQ